MTSSVEQMKALHGSSTPFAAIRENFLSDEACDFLMTYYKKYKKSEKWENTYVMFMDQTNPLHIRKNLIRNYYLNSIRKDFPLKLTYDQLVYWPSGSFKPKHLDGTTAVDAHLFGKNEWTSVCYLNDNFQGGETILDNDVVNPKKGRLLVFNSKNIPHGVLETFGPRYTYIAWWQEK